MECGGLPPLCCHIFDSGRSIFTSAGARWMVERPTGNLKPELVGAVETRSGDSLTAASGNPTMTMAVSPDPELSADIL